MLKEGPREFGGWEEGGKEKKRRWCSFVGWSMRFPCARSLNGVQCFHSLSLFVLRLSRHSFKKDAMADDCTSFFGDTFGATRMVWGKKQAPRWCCCVVFFRCLFVAIFVGCGGRVHFSSLRITFCRNLSGTFHCHQRERCRPTCSVSLPEEASSVQRLVVWSLGEEEEEEGRMWEKRVEGSGRGEFTRKEMVSWLSFSCEEKATVGGDGLLSQPQ